ncbi:MAG: hypothetical protein PHZ00_00685 [Candidatus Peribacteraceae bacterium]|nr:hypothetical protein [Candidatus Peribacteraceae bacterium]
MKDRGRKWSETVSQCIPDAHFLSDTDGHRKSANVRQLSMLRGFHRCIVVITSTCRSAIGAHRLAAVIAELHVLVLAGILLGGVHRMRGKGDNIKDGNRRESMTEVVVKS